MPTGLYERLTALDASFLLLEDHDAHMHVGSVALFDLGPLRGAHGGLDMDRVLARAGEALAAQPRFRERLTTTPLFGDPVWVDDPHFNLAYHVRHAALPAPGDERQLKRLAGRIMSQQLDRAKPLWELWFVEGVAGDRFAVIAKLHHCMVDGIASADLMGALLRPDREARPHPAAPAIPRPEPTPTRLLADALLRRARLPFELLRASGAAAVAPLQTLSAAGRAVGSVGEALRTGLTPASPTVLNGSLGPHRRFDWLRVDLAAVKRAAHRHDATVNDLVLAITAGAVGDFLRRRGEPVDGIDFRAMIPVSIRANSEHHALGNRVALLVAALPIDERDPRRRLARVIDTMRAVKRSEQRRGTELLEAASERLFSDLFARLARFGARLTPYNLVVTNVPGPPVPLYLFGAPLRAVYPLVPLFTHQALGIALFSYAGSLYWGFNADWDALPDLHELVTAVERECAALTAPPRAATRRRRPTPRPAPAHARTRRRSA
jgi:WS/DGAT/MGAT family acyltransferase